MLLLYYIFTIILLLQIKGSEMKARKFNKIKIPDSVLANLVDGKDYIDLNSTNTKLGLMLTPMKTFKYPIELFTLKVFNIYKFMMYLGHKNYPAENFMVPYYKGQIDKSTRLQKREVKNFWGVIVSLLILKVRKDKELLEELKKNTIPFNFFEKEIKESTLFGKAIQIKEKKRNIHGYAKACEYVQDLVKYYDIHNDEEISKILLEDFPDLPNTIMTVVEGKI